MRRPINCQLKNYKRMGSQKNCIEISLRNNFESLGIWGQTGGRSGGFPRGGRAVGRPAGRADFPGEQFRTPWYLYHFRFWWSRLIGLLIYLNCYIRILGTTPFPFSKPTAPFPFFGPHNTLSLFRTPASGPTSGRTRGVEQAVEHAVEQAVSNIKSWLGRNSYYY